MNICNIYRLLSDCYGINCRNIQWERGVGEESRVYRIFGEPGSYALKIRFSEGEALEGFEEGARAALHLQTRGFHTTPAPIPCRDDSLMARHEDLIAMLYPWVDRYSIGVEDKAETMRSIGVAYAQFHRASVGFKGWSEVPTAESLLLRIERLRKLIQEAVYPPKGISRAELGAVLERAQEFMVSSADDFTRGAGAASLLYQAAATDGSFVHGDPSPTNMLLDTERRIHIIDLENILQETRWWDLAGLGLRLIENPESIQNLLRGYYSVCRLDSWDFDALPILANPLEDLVWEMEAWTREDRSISTQVSRFRKRYIEGPGPFELYELLREEVRLLAGAMDLS